MKHGVTTPSAIDIEKVVLGAMMIDVNALNRGLHLFKEEIFYHPVHRIIFQAIRNLYSSKEPVDHMTVFTELQRTGKNQDVGGSAYIIELTENISGAANFEYYARIVLEKSILRDLIDVGQMITATAYNTKDDALAILDMAERKIFEVAQTHIKRTYVELKNAVNETIDYIEAVHSKDYLRDIAVPTGYYDLDNLLGGFQKSDMIVLAARPSMGKTAFALNLARRAAEYTPVAFFSLEMNLKQIVIRLLSTEAELESHKVRTGKIPNASFHKLAMAASKLVEAPMFIDDSPAQTVMEITSKARKLKAEKGIGFIVIDYLQLMTSSEKMESREREISYISRSLKSLAKELDIPVMALSQLNRAVESRHDKRPMLSDLRESGSIEQDSDIVMFIHRAEYYGIKTEGEQSMENVADIIIAKNRNGPVGDVKLTFLKEFGKFESALLQRQYNEIPESSSFDTEDAPI